VKNQTLTPPPQETPKTKARKKETTAAGKMGDWQRLLAPLAANADELQHLEMPRAKLAAMAAQAAELKQQQAARQAAKQEASKQLQEMLIEGTRLASLLRQAVKQHYGIRSEKLVEFGVPPLRHDEDCLEEGEPDPAPLCPLVDGQTREPKDGERIARKAPVFRGLEIPDLDLRRRHRDEPDDASCLLGDVGGADVVLELVLSRESLEEPVEVRISAGESLPVVAGPDRQRRRAARRADLPPGEGDEGRRQAPGVRGGRGAARQAAGAQGGADLCGVGRCTISQIPTAAG
jgi:hypothetical protein